MPDAPLTILPAAGSGSAPDAPLTVLAEAGSGSAPDSPVTVLAEAGSGSAPSSPVTVLAAAGSGSAPDAPVTVLTVDSLVGRSFDFADSEVPDRDGTYVYLGFTESVIPVWARDDGTTAIVDNVLTGSGMIFIQRDNGSGLYIWSLETNTEWDVGSPTVLMTHLTGEATRAVEPTPPDAAEWFDVLADGPPESISFTTASGLTSPVAVLAAAGSGSAPSAPVAVLPAASAASAPLPPYAILGAPVQGLYNTNNQAILNTDGTALEGTAA